MQLWKIFAFYFQSVEINSAIRRSVSIRYDVQFFCVAAYQLCFFVAEDVIS
jgi:hypothetical protein